MTSPRLGRDAPLLRFAPFAHTTHVFAPAELIGYVAGVLEADPLLGDVWLRGEVASASRSPAGHHYFSLRDEQAQLRCVLFRGSAFNSPVMPANGLALVAHGSLRIYERSGACELVADLLFPEGVGLAQLQAERLYRRLEAEGLFSPARKRPLPAWPARIGVVSSERGAVIHDLLSVVGRRFPLAEVVWVPAPVQGPGAAAAMQHALVRLGLWRRDGQPLDVIVLARGGGSDDDLAAFNDERLVRAVFASPVAVVSAVGHATNLTLVDLVADLRAPTPSAAAELLVPDVQAIGRDVAALGERAQVAIGRRLADARHETARAQARAEAALGQRLQLERARLAGLSARLATLSPQQTLRRGYAIVTTADGRLLREAGAVSSGALVQVQLHRGRLASRVEAVEPEA